MADGEKKLEKFIYKNSILLSIVLIILINVPGFINFTFEDIIKSNYTIVIVIYCLFIVILFYIATKNMVGDVFSAGVGEVPYAEFIKNFPISTIENSILNPLFLLIIISYLIFISIGINKIRSSTIKFTTVQSIVNTIITIIILCMFFIILGNFMVSSTQKYKAGAFFLNDPKFLIIIRLFLLVIPLYYVYNNYAYNTQKNIAQSKQKKTPS